MMMATVLFGFFLETVQTNKKFVRSKGIIIVIIVDNTLFPV